MKSKAALCAVVLFLGLGVPRAFAQLQGSEVLFPHIGNGVLPNGAGTWTTQLVLLNNSASTASGGVMFLDEGGNNLTLETDRGTDYSFDISIPAHGLYTLETTGTGALVMGSAGGYFDHAVVGTAVFTYSTAQGKMTRVGVMSRLPMTTFLTPAEANTGIAIANPYGWPTQVEIRAYDSNGAQFGSTQTLTLSPGGHVANNVNVWWPVPANFQGSVRVYSLDSWVNCLAIGFTHNTLFDPAYSVSAISYDQLSTSYTGSMTLYYGPNAGNTGTMKVDGVEHFASNFFTGTMTSYNSTLGMTFTGPVMGNEDDYGLLYSFCFYLSPIDNVGWAIAQSNGDGSFSGYIVDDGAGNYGYFDLTPVAGSGSTIVRRSMRRTGKLSDYVIGPRLERLLPPPKSE
jgi:hypothetical protein